MVVESRRFLQFLLMKKCKPDMRSSLLPSESPTMRPISKISYLYKEITRALKTPGLLRQLCNRKYLEIVRANFRVGKTWAGIDRQGKFTQRTYSSYEDYLAHQKNKLDYIGLVREETAGLLDYDVRYREVLRERLQTLDIAWPGKTVLCLAARLGTEVKSFLDLGCFAVGIDLNPGANNLYVLYGDFHDLQFPSDSVDLVFSNSLDHVFDLPRFVGEIQRVLKPAGILLLEVQKGREEGRTPGFYESFWWSTLDDLIALLRTYHLHLVNRLPFDYPWTGEQLAFTPFPEEQP